jgi:hypothetical protein
MYNSSSNVKGWWNRPTNSCGFIAWRMAGHAKIKTAQVYDRRAGEVSFSEIERGGI